MNKKITRVFATLVAFIMTITGVTLSAQAASYPELFFFGDEDYNELIVEDEATVGDVVYIRMKWYAAFNYEGYDLAIYDSNKNVVATCSNTFTNVDYVRKFNIRWDTSDQKPGKYLVEVTKKFYSYYHWNEAPTKKTMYITLNPNTNEVPTEETMYTTSNPNTNEVPTKETMYTTSNPNTNEKVKKPKATSIKKISSSKNAFEVKWKKVSGVKGYQIQYTTDKDFDNAIKTKTVKKDKSTSTTVKKLKSKKTYYVRVRTYKASKVNGKTVKVYSSWSKIKSIKIK